MAIFHIPNMSISGIATCVPKQQVANMDCDLLLEKDRKLFVKSTGIANRRIADAGVCASDLCQKAALTLIEALKWNKSEIQFLIFVTQTPDYITPSTAVILQHKLGLSKSCVAFDINLGCSGYVYGLSVIAALMQNMPHSKGLLLTGDVSSACISPNDKSTVPLFSDAGAATSLVNTPSLPGIYFNLQSDGAGYDNIMIPEGAYRNPFHKESLRAKIVEPGIERNGVHLILKGIDIFNFSVNEVPKNIQQLAAFVPSFQPDFYVLHQANKIINDSIVDELKEDANKFPSSLYDFGNSSIASIPLTMTYCISKKLSSEKLNLLLSGFGVGLSWASAYIATDAVVCPEMITY